MLMRDCGGRTVGEVIPHEPLGKLDDDVKGFEPDLQTNVHKGLIGTPWADSRSLSG
jgi:hypothetical protein